MNQNSHTIELPHAILLHLHLYWDLEDVTEISQDANHLILGEAMVFFNKKIPNKIFSLTFFFHKFCVTLFKKKSAFPLVIKWSAPNKITSTYQKSLITFDWACFCGLFQTISGN